MQICKTQLLPGWSCFPVSRYFLLSVCFLLIPQLIIFLFSRRRHPPRHRRHRKYRKYRHDRQYRQAKTADFLASALFLVADWGGLSRGCRAVFGWAGQRHRAQDTETGSSPEPRGLIEMYYWCQRFCSIERDSIVARLVTRRRFCSAGEELEIGALVDIRGKVKHVSARV